MNNNVWLCVLFISLWHSLASTLKICVEVACAPPRMSRYYYYDSYG